ncbi:MAG: 50S ribosomal protein L23 [Candidatus Gracilibacteria bacterium]|jgi:large subunit ribosomal protein L23|nr:50S ribosomal protein L23 [Candidatus Gracilibacteria bacterium]
MKTYTVILKPLITEKSAIDQTKGVYSFLINRTSTKIDVKKAVEQIYGKKVKSVTTQLQPKKVRVVGRGRVLTKRNFQKIAKVTLVGRESIDINKVGEKKASTKTTTKTNKIKAE